MLPGIGNTYGNETIIEHVGALNPDFIVTLMDVWVLDPSVWGQLNVASWVPVDHEPAPDPVRDFFTASGAVPIAMSRFGESQLADLDPLYVPHAVDCDVLKPLGRAESRAEIGLPEDCFMVGMVAANKGTPSRKNFADAFRAFKALADKHPDAYLYVHTEATGRFGGEQLPKLADAVGIDRKRIFWADQYRTVHMPFSQEHMARVFSALDVLISPSAGEGFGIPVIEAQACGTPVIVSDFSAQPELVGAGWTVEGDKTWTPIGSWQFDPDIADLIEALARAYNAAGSDLHRQKARKKAEEYHVETVVEKYMLPALAECLERFEDRPVDLRTAA